MGYGNRCIYRIDVQIQGYRYLQYIKTEECEGEKTFRLEDKQTFKDLADIHAKTEGEQDVYERLFSARRDIHEEQHGRLWWSLVLGVEASSNLRQSEVATRKSRFRDTRLFPLMGSENGFNTRRYVLVHPVEGQLEQSKLVFRQVHPSI